MDIQAAVGGGIEHRLRQDQAISRDHRYVGVQRGEIGLRRCPAQTRRGADGQAMRLGPIMHRAPLQFLAALRRARRLGIDGGNIMPRRDQCGERRHRKGRRAHEDDAHGWGFGGGEATVQ